MDVGTRLLPHHQNRRKDYIQAFLSLVNWEAVSARLDGALGAVR